MLTARTTVISVSRMPLLELCALVVRAIRRRKPPGTWRPIVDDEVRFQSDGNSDDPGVGIRELFGLPSGLWSLSTPLRGVACLAKYLKAASAKGVLNARSSSRELRDITKQVDGACAIAV